MGRRHGASVDRPRIAKHKELGNSRSSKKPCKFTLLWAVGNLLLRAFSEAFLSRGVGSEEMDRRGFVTGGAAAAAALGPLSGVRSAAAAVVRKAQTVFDFGAVGDGITDDSAAFKRALHAAAMQGKMILVPGCTYAIAETILLSFATEVSKS